LIGGTIASWRLYSIRASFKAAEKSEATRQKLLIPEYQMSMLKTETGEVGFLTHLSRKGVQACRD
jgi:hypothetical protein